MDLTIVGLAPRVEGIGRTGHLVQRTLWRWLRVILLGGLIFA